MVRVHDATQQAMTKQFLPDGEKLPNAALMQQTVLVSDEGNDNAILAGEMSCLNSHPICKVFSLFWNISQNQTLF